MKFYVIWWYLGAEDNPPKYSEVNPAGGFDDQDTAIRAATQIARIYQSKWAGSPASRVYRIWGVKEISL